MSPSMDGKSQKKRGLTENEKGLPFSGGESVIDGHRTDELADGRGDETMADLREEGRQRARVRMAIGEYFGRKRRRR